VGQEGAAQSGLNQIVDDALEAFISVLDQHTLADMAEGSRTFTDAGPGGRSVKSATSRGPTLKGRRGPQQATAG
jgi:hypothetical protein